MRYAIEQKRQPRQALAYLGDGLRIIFNHHQKSAASPGAPAPLSAHFHHQLAAAEKTIILTEGQFAVVITAVFSIIAGSPGTCHIDNIRTLHIIVLLGPFDLVALAAPATIDHDVRFETVPEERSNWQLESAKHYQVI